jgi:hypothetical protein
MTRNSKPEGETNRAPSLDDMHWREQAIALFIPSEANERNGNVTLTTRNFAAKVGDSRALLFVDTAFHLTKLRIPLF